MASRVAAAAAAATVLLLLVARCSHSVDAATAPKVQLALYYESLCPFSASFIVNYLYKIFTTGLIEILDFELLPYGNARVGTNGTITCQHGPYECLLNTVEACAIDAWPDVNVYFKFIYCVERLVVEGKYTQWGSCFQALGLNAEPVLSCFSSEYGKQLELHYAAVTDALQPPHTYVPWVVVDGQPLYEDYEDFETYVCMAYKGELPQACADLLLRMKKTTVQTDKAGRVCHRIKEDIPSLVRLSAA